jgi:hypothetical protein
MFSIRVDDGAVSSDATGADWVLLYATVDQPLERAITSIRDRFPRAQVFGATSFQGVFHERGFDRGVFGLACDAGEGVHAHAALRTGGARRARIEATLAVAEIREHLGREPDALLLHATPGFEEAILAGVGEAFGEATPAPLYGGSAADDDLSGKWRVFKGDVAIEEGFVLIGFASDQPMHGSFVAGYTPGTRRARVTSAQGRRIITLDGQPAARLYNEWVQNALGDMLESGGVVLSRTSLHPLGRVVDRVGAVPRYLLSHPHAIDTDGSLSLFTDIQIGDEVVLMLGSQSALIDRTDQAASRASRGADQLRGGVLVYCAGCVGTIGEAAAEVGCRFFDRIGKVPFAGIASFGEQGCFVAKTKQNRHGNLMCDAILFE